MKQDACALEAAQHYLSTLAACHALGPETTCSVAVDADVASALLAIAGQSKQAKSMMERAIALHFALVLRERSGVQWLILGSVIKRVISTAMVPLLAVRPLAPYVHEPAPRFSLM